MKSTTEVFAPSDRIVGPCALACTVACTLAIAFAAPAIAQQRLSLGAAVRMGVANSRQVRMAEARAAGAEARAAEMRTTLLPSVRFEGGYRRLSDVDPFRVQLPGMPVPVTISPVVLDNWSSRVGVQQPLFTGFKLAANARAAARLSEAAEEDRVNEQEEAILSTMGGYWTLYQAREVRKSVGENVKRLERLVADGAHMMKAGMLTRADQLRFEVQLSNARIMAIDAESDATLAEMNCNSLLGLPLDSPLELTSDPEEAPSAGGDTLVGDPLLMRADFRAIGARVEAARSAVTAARGSWWPQVALAGNYYYGRPNARYMPTRDEWKGTWDVGVTLSLDLWNWGATLRQTEQAEANLRQSEESLALMKDRVQLEVARAGAQLKRATERTAMAVLALEQARESQRITRERFSAGTAIPADLLDAEVSLLQAETSLAGARIEKRLAAARLAKAAGRLEIPSVEGSDSLRKGD